MTTEENKNPNCVFCKIVEGVIPSYKVYEDELFFGFLTIKPETKGHMLLIPKNHSENILKMKSGEYQKYFSVARNLAEKIQKIFNPKRVAFVVAGLEVNHTHLHLYQINETENMNPHAVYDLSKDEAQEVLEIYKNNI